MTKVHKASMKICSCLLFLVVYTGCVAIYENHSIEISATDVLSKQPAANYPVQVQYHYDHYDVPFFKYWNAPKNVIATTNDKGILHLEIATFFRPLLIVGSTEFILTKSLIISGGVPYKQRFRGTGQDDYVKHRKLHKEWNLPEILYPDVDVLILKTPNQKDSPDQKAVR